ncbi:hypothetical protein [Kiloniella sp.]|uniref:hypothetical protein n=1 Tax=Kiloniella sp. TaxID=1938587 RepID=UPI003B018C72
MDKPTVTLRLTMAAFMILVGYLTLGKIYAHLGIYHVHDHSHLNHARYDDLISLPGFFLAGYFILPRFLSGAKNKIFKAFIGGALAYGFAIVVHTLIDTVLGLGPVTVQLYFPITADNLNFILFDFSSMILVATGLSPIGGAFVLAFYLGLFKLANRRTFWAR